MSNSTQLQNNLDLIERHTAQLNRMLNAVQQRDLLAAGNAGFAPINAGIKASSKSLKSLASQTKAIDAYTPVADQLAKTNQQLKAAKQNVTELTAKMLKTPHNQRTVEQIEQLEKAKLAMGDILKVQGKLDNKVQNKAQKLKALGVDPDNIGNEKARVNNGLNGTQNTLSDQQQLKNALKQQQQGSRQQRVEAVLQQYQNHSEKIEKISDLSATGMDFAKEKLGTAKDLFEPGIKLQKDLSDLQAQLGLQKNAPQVIALRQQAMSMAASGHSPEEVVKQQSTLAEEGLNAEQILRKTPQKLNGETAAEQVQLTVKGDNLDGDIKKLFASWDTIRIDLFDGQSSALRGLTQTATQWLSTLGQWIKDNPQLVNTILSLGLGLAGLIGGLGSLGAVITPIFSGINMLMAGASLLGTVFSSVGTAIAATFGTIGLPLLAIIALIAAGVALVIKFWEPIKAFIGGMIEGFSAALEPLKGLFEPLKIAFKYISDLLTPINSTKESLDNAAKYGKIFGEILGIALTAPIRVFNQLSEGISWIMEKLGIASKKKIELDNGLSDKSHSELSPAQLKINNTLTPGYNSLNQGDRNSVADNSTTTNNITITVPPGSNPNTYAQALAETTKPKNMARNKEPLSNYNRQEGYGI